MSAQQPTPRERLEALLAMWATKPLSPEERQELDALLGVLPETDLMVCDQAAAAIDLAFIAQLPVEPMPESVRRKVEACAREFAARRCTEQRGDLRD